MSDRANRFRYFLDSEVGQEVIALLDSEAKEPEDELYEIMSKKPDTLTGKTALKFAIRAKALRDFKETLLDVARKADPK